MRNQPTIAGETAREYCLKYPQASSLQLARMLKRDHPAMYRDVEHARSCVRYLRGAHGAAQRQKIEHAGRRVDRLELPEPAPSGWYRFALPKTATRWLILADIHAPYHDKDALHIAIEYGKAQKCDGVIFLGDLIDHYTLSVFCKDPTKRTFLSELHTVSAILQVVQARLKPKATIWRGANHEYRLERFLYGRAPELLAGAKDPPPNPLIADVEKHFALSTFLKLTERGVTWVDPKCPIDCGKLSLFHGDEWHGGTSTPVNPARTLYLRAHECAIAGHFHQTSEHTEVTSSGTTVTTWSVGALCDLHPEYAPLNKWNHGLGILRTAGEWTFENRRIVKGRVL